MKKLSECTIIGKIINTRGIKGEVKIFPLTSSVHRFSDLITVFIGKNLEEFEVSNVSYDDRFVYLKFKNIDNINDILRFKDEFLYIDDADRIELEENTFFINDIIGCKVFDLNDNELGEIKDVIENPVNDLYLLKSETGESLIPAVSQFVKKIDIDNKIIVIDPIEGLIN
ncbi:ribosome maturation factor RimM [Peptoniphilus sp. oral taxon 386]|uniref:ribosome maturation factor RimM n=1 Tax=Peptoniphilus sp. oral taxon 386 TaxID=652713 RepID=UPI0001DA9C74|nr:ribosome maturation factor RimM [Peptoniphilus sp. oral taxon 386]EFI42230.1 16S rRNA processing protein RimM [Peptoniphilus sp. oral taxon 386 str. F0131]